MRGAFVDTLEPLLQRHPLCFGYIFQSLSVTARQLWLDREEKAGRQSSVSNLERARLTGQEGTRTGSQDQLL